MEGTRGIGWTWLDTTLLAAVTVVAAAIRIIGLDSPDSLVFDEIFYAQNACLLVADPGVCGISEPVSNAHPPLGQWLIAAGIAIAGYVPEGWRAASVVAGTLTVSLTYLLGRLLLQNSPPRLASAGATVAALLLAVDVLSVVQSRVAMLDVFVALFVVAAFTALVVDLGTGASPPGRGIGRFWFGRPWRLAAGILVGAAVAVKWSGAYSAVGVVLLIVVAEVAWRRQPEARWTTALGSAVRNEGLRTAALFGVVPLIIYLASYVGVAQGSVLAAPWTEGSWWYQVAHHQVAMARFHAGLEGQHPYESPPWSWFLLKRPVAYYFQTDGEAYRHILALGSPLAWWPALLVFGTLVVSWIRRRDWPAGIVIIGALSAYLPWLILGATRSQVFLWYVLPTLPFVYFAAGLALTRWRGLGRAGIGLVVAAGVLSMAFFWPVATASPLTPPDWQQRIWFTDCARPGAPNLELPDDQINEGPPPEGWCWI
jgi:dolichyl-phosphate-mannose--protein O-mannosyl transferase